MLISFREYEPDRAAMPEPMTAGRRAYEADCAARPFYDDGTKRRAWHELDAPARESWERNPMRRAWPAYSDEWPRPFAEFRTGAEARAAHAARGGFIFEAEDGGAILFPPGFTPTAIFNHPLTNGKSGRLC